MPPQERTAFLKWRRNLALLEEEEGLVLTPFEKNLEVWRQLWRVLERSDIVVQVCSVHVKPKPVIFVHVKPEPVLFVHVKPKPVLFVHVQVPYRKLPSPMSTHS